MSAKSQHDPTKHGFGQNSPQKIRIPAFGANSTLAWQTRDELERTEGLWHLGLLQTGRQFAKACATGGAKVAIQEIQRLVNDFKTKELLR